MNFTTSSDPQKPVSMEDLLVAANKLEQKMRDDYEKDPYVFARDKVEMVMFMTRSDYERLKHQHFEACYREATPKTMFDIAPMPFGGYTVLITESVTTVGWIPKWE